MRLHHILLLAAAAILASADATTSEGKPVAAGQNNKPAKRVLRAETKVSDEEEERAFWNAKLPESLTNLFKSGTMSTVTSKIAAQDDLLVQMLKKGDSVDDALKSLKLADDVDNLLTNANLDKFATYVGMINKANKKAGKPEVNMIEAITKNYGDAAVARMLYNAKQVKSTEKLATDLEGALINTWLKGSPPKPVKEVFKLLSIKGPFDTNMHIWGAFKNMQAATRV